MSPHHGAVGARTVRSFAWLLLTIVAVSCGGESSDPEVPDASVHVSAQALMSDADGDGVGDASDNL